MTEELERPEGQTLQNWNEWAAKIDDYPCGEYASDYENQAEQYDTKLFSLNEIKNIINHWRQDQGSLFDEDTDIPRLIKLFKDRGDLNGRCKEM